MEVHHEIDDETREVAGSPGVWLLEGQHLDLVLASLSDATHIQLICDLKERARRMGLRSGTLDLATAAVLERDLLEVELRRRLYGEAPSSAQPAATIDTTQLTADEVALALVRVLEEPS